MKFIAALCLTLLSLSLAHAQDVRRLVVGFPPGGTLDVLARTLAPALGDDLGQTVLIENQAGAGSLLAAQSVARAKPDGHTLLVAPVVVPADDDRHLATRSAGTLQRKARDRLRS